MQSKIRIEFDFDTNQPVLRITQAKESDDLRDTMLKSFIQKATLGGTHLYFTYPQNNTDNSVLDLRCEIEPSTPPTCKTEGLTFGEALEYLKQGLKVTLPEWKGYWFKKNGAIWVHKEDGNEEDNPWYAETIWRNDWQIFEDK